MINGLSPWHLLIIAVVIIVLFGSKKLPDAARSLGKSLRIFKSEVKELQNDGKADAPAPTQVESQRVDPAAGVTERPAAPQATDARSA